MIPVELQYISNHQWLPISNTTYPLKGGDVERNILFEQSIGPVELKNIELHWNLHDRFFSFSFEELEVEGKRKDNIKDYVIIWVNPCSCELCDSVKNGYSVNQ